MRLCSIDGRKAMFHCWQQISDTVSPYPFQDSRQGTTIRYTAGIVEFEDGGVKSVKPDEIIFLDTSKVLLKVEREIAKWEAKQQPVTDTIESVPALTESRMTTSYDDIEAENGEPQLQSKRGRFALLNFNSEARKRNSNPGLKEAFNS